MLVHADGDDEERVHDERGAECMDGEVARGAHAPEFPSGGQQHERTSERTRVREPDLLECADGHDALHGRQTGTDDPGVRDLIRSPYNRGSYFLPASLCPRIRRTSVG